MEVSLFSFHAFLSFFFKTNSFLFLFFLSFSSACFSSLILSEIYIDGTDEWLEISNISEDIFQQEITLIGVKSSPLVLDITIQPGSSLLLGDTMDMITTSVQSIQNLGFSLTDTSRIFVELIIGGQVVDIFEIDETTVQGANDTKSSFEKVCTDVLCSYKIATENNGLLDGYQGSPGIFDYTITPVSGTGSHTSTGDIDMNTGSTTMSGSTYITGVTTTGIVLGTGTEVDWGTGQTMTGETTGSSGSMATGTILGSGTSTNDDTPPLSNESGTIGEELGYTWGDIRIIEVHPNDTDVLGEYIIIESDIVYTGPVRFVSLGQGTAEKIANISILPGQTLLITDTTNNIDSSVAWYTFPSITLTDGGEPLSVFIDDELIDSIVYTHVDDGYVSTYTETIGGTRLFSTASKSSVVLDQGVGVCSVIVSPGTSEYGYTNYTLEIVTPDPIWCSPWYEQKRMIGDTIYTGCSIETRFSSGHHFLSASITNQTHNICSSFLSIYDTSSESVVSSGGSISTELVYGDIIITEVYPKDSDIFSEYIELYFYQPYAGDLRIGGLGHGSADKTISLQVGQGSRVIITDAAGSLSKDTTYYILPSISLTDSGETLQLYGHSGQVIDTLVYTAGIADTSLYFTEYTSSGDRLFFTHDIPTPGFTRDQIRFLFPDETEEKISSCAIKMQHSTPLFVGNKINLIARVGDKDIQNSSSTYTCERDFAGSAYIFETGCNPSFYDYGSEGVYTVDLRIRNIHDNSICHTSLDINYPAKNVGGGSSRTNKSGDTYYQGLYKKRKERFETLKKQTKALGYSVSTSGHILTPGLLDTGAPISILSGIITIDQVLPNPSGNDTDREQIILSNHTNTSLSLAGYKLFNGTSRKKLPEDIVVGPHSSVIITASLGLTNRATCLQLQYENDVYDIFCYPQADDDVRFDTSLEGLEISSLQPSNLDALKNMSLTIHDDQACIFFNKESVLCKGLERTKEEVQARKKDAKKYTTVNKHLDKEKERAANRKDKYHNQVAKRRTEADRYKARIADEKGTTTRYRTQSRLHQNFIYMIFDELQGSWGPLYYSSVLPGRKKSYDAAMKTLQNSSLHYTSKGVDIPVEDIEYIIAIEHEHILPLVYQHIENTYQKTLQESTSTLASFLENLRTYDR